MGFSIQDYEVWNLPVTYLVSGQEVIKDKIFGGGLTLESITNKVDQMK